jgi:hypothetical protein
MDARPLPTTIPGEFYGFFWDVDPTKVNPAQKPHFVINQLLDKGNLSAARWVIRNFSYWNGVFWARYLNMPREEVRCLHPSYLAMRRMHWPF